MSYFRIPKMPLCIMAILISAIYWPTRISSAAFMQCNPKSEVSGSYNEASNPAQLVPTSDNLPAVTLNFDSGFIKLTEQDMNQKELFRQGSIRKNTGDTFDLTVRYDRVNKIKINTKSIFVVDPLCKRNDFSAVSIFEISELKYSGTFYHCECLSVNFDSSHFTVLD